MFSDDDDNLQLNHYRNEHSFLTTAFKQMCSVCLNRVSNLQPQGQLWLALISYLTYRIYWIHCCTKIIFLNMIMYYFSFNISMYHWCPHIQCTIKCDWLAVQWQLQKNTYQMKGILFKNLVLDNFSIQLTYLYEKTF